jgi:hypothetical protein
MRAIGLCALLLGTLEFLLPYYRIYVPILAIGNADARVLAGLLVAGGATMLVWEARR